MVFARQVRFVRWRTSLNTETLVVGGVGVVSRRTQHPTPHQSKPTDQYPPAHHARSPNSDSDPNKNGKTAYPVATHQPTNNPYTPIHTHRDSMFLRWHASLNSESEPKTNAGTQKKWTGNAVT